MKATGSIIVALLLMNCAALGQQEAQTSQASQASQASQTSQASEASQTSQTSQTSDTEGKELGGYQVQQSVELGYRFVDVAGSKPVYSTLINQNQGPRLLEQTLSVRTPESQASIFDDLYVSSFGWGGDPENVAQARLHKRHYYDLNFLFRRDQNYFDYNLIGNPLNPTTSNPFLPVTTAPHATYNMRRMYNFDLTVLPQSKFSFRLGFNHNRANGPDFSSVHVGTDALLNQGFNVTQNTYRFGVDVKVLPHTVISYDQFLDYGKNDTAYTLANFATFPLPNGVPVELGLPFNTAAGQPCSAPVTNGVANPTCNGFFAFNVNQRIRTTNPTEQLRIVSNFHRLSIVAQGTYSHTDLSVPYSEFFDGLSSRSSQRQATVSGPVNTERINPTADLGITYELTEHVRISESFRYENWHLPGSFNSVSTSTKGVTSSLLSALGATTTTNLLELTVLGQRTFYNLVQVEYTPSKTVGIRAGYKIRNRHLFHAEPEAFDPTDPEQTFEPLEGDVFHINEQGAVLGAWLRPRDNLRINLEGEGTTVIGCQTCNNPDIIFITRVSPRQRFNYRARADYKPVRWANLAGSWNWWRSRNGASDVLASQHYRNIGFVLSLVPDKPASVEVSYNFTNSQYNSFICYNSTVLVAGSTASGCPTFDSSDNNNPNQIYSVFNTRTHFFNGVVVLHPINRVTAKLGYGVTTTDGETVLLNPLQPTGPLQFTFHQPLAALSFEVIKAWSLNAYWNYDQYSEDSVAGPTLPRNFHDNRATLSVKYAF